MADVTMIRWPEGWLDGALIGSRQEAKSDDGNAVLWGGCTDKGTNLWMIAGDDFTMLGRFTCDGDGNAGPWEEDITGEPSPTALMMWAHVVRIVEKARVMSVPDLLADAGPASPETEGR